MLLARLYNNSWNLENLEQDFRLKYDGRSLAAKLHQKHSDLTIFNGTSYAFASCLKMTDRLVKNYNSVRVNKALESGLHTVKTDEEGLFPKSRALPKS
jgi:hypothetical protein